jgi:anaerobic magnesium-protoporphyrin IX monomethyl ester cyclase
LLYIAANVRAQRDDEIKVIDAFCENLTKESLVNRVLKESPDVVGLNCSTHTFLDSINALKDIRKELPDSTLILGGYHATFAAERILKEYPYVDYIIKGEAENALIQLLQCIESGKKPSNVEGISFLDNGKCISNELALIKDLDSLPFPARDLTQGIEYGYFHRGIRLTIGKFTSINTARGCPFKCSYCSCAAFSQRKWRHRSAENVVDEMEILFNQGYESCVVVDDNFTFNPKRVEKICDLIRFRKIKLQFYCEGRADNASYSLMKKMKRAGFNVIYFGAENASQHVLDYYNKTITPEQTKKAVKNAKKAGMNVVTSFIFGAPVESKEDILNTIDFIKQIRPHAVQINILECLLGTPIWDGLVKDGFVASDDWKTHHRVYEYFQDGLSQEELEDLVDQGYSAYINGWKNIAGLKEFFRVLMSNKTTRKIIFHNLFNPNLKKRLSQEMKHFEDDYRKHLY